jgi:hypothetical protein
LDFGDDGLVVFAAAQTQGTLETRTCRCATPKVRGTAPSIT